MFKLVAIILLFGVAGFAQQPRLVSNSKVTYMHAMITYMPFTVTITNQDRFDWIDVEFECAPTPLSDARFTYRRPTVKAGETIRIPIEKFLDTKGQSMPLANPREGVMSAKCHTPGGYRAVRSARFGSTYSPGPTPPEVR